MNKENTPVPYSIALSQALIDNFHSSNNCSVLLKENFDRDSSEFEKMTKIVSRWNNIVKNQSSTFTTSGKPLDDCSSIKTLELLCKITGKTPNQVLGIENTTPLPNDIELYNLEEVLALCRILIFGDRDTSKRPEIVSRVHSSFASCKLGKTAYIFNTIIRFSPYQSTFLILNINKTPTIHGEPDTGKTELSFHVFVPPLSGIMNNLPVISTCTPGSTTITYDSRSSLETFQKRIEEAYEKAFHNYDNQIDISGKVEPNLASVLTKAFSFADTQEDLNILQRSNYFKKYPPVEEEPIAEESAVDKALYDATQRSGNTNE